MATELGKELRKLRIDQNERLFDMSRKLNKSSAFISAVELGKKPVPAGFEELVIRAYGLVGEMAKVIRRAADRSRSAFSVKADSPLARDTAGLMARRMNSLSDDDMKKIISILKKGESE